MSVEALLGTDRAFAADLHRAAAAGRPGRERGEPAQPCSPARRSSPATASDDDRVQDAYSLRCAPQVNGAARDTLAHAERVAARELAVRDRQPDGAARRPRRVVRQLPRRAARLRARLPRHRGRRGRRRSPSAAPTGCSTRAARTGCRRSSPPDAGRQLRADDRPVHAGGAGGREPAAGRARERRLAPDAARCRRTTCRWAGRPRASCAPRSATSRASSAIELTCAAHGLDLRAPLQPGAGGGRGAGGGPLARSTGRGRIATSRRTWRRPRSWWPSGALRGGGRGRGGGAGVKGARPVRAPRGTELSCKGWPQEAALRMLMNNLDPEVAERPDDLVVYGGTGRAARSWEAFDAIVRALRDAGGRRDAARAVGQAGRRVAHARVGAARADRQLQPRAGVGDVGRVPPARGARADDVRADDRGLVDLHRHPGHRAGDLRVLRGDRAAALRRLAGGHDHADRRARRDGRRAAAGGDDERRGRAVRRGRRAAHPAAARDALPRRAGRRPRRRGRALPGRARRAAGAVGRAARQRGRRAARSCSRRASRPTSSPTRRAPTTRWAATCRTGCRVEEADRDAARRPGRVRAPLARRDGRPLRGDGRLHGRAAPRCSTTATRCARRRSSAASSAPSTTRASCPPTCGRCSARGRARSAGSRCPATRPTSRRPTARCSRSSPTTSGSARWIRRRARRSRSRACRRGSAGSATASGGGSGCASTRWCASGELSAPIVIGRDHLDSGSVASPYRETEAMADESDAIADWPLLNALVNTSSGASWVSIHHGGGVGIGRSIHAGMVCVADGTDARGREARARADRRPGHGRHPARRRGLRPGGRGRGGARRAHPDAGMSVPRDRHRRRSGAARAGARGDAARSSRSPAVQAADRRPHRDEARGERRGPRGEPGRRDAAGRGRRGRAGQPALPVQAARSPLHRDRQPGARAGRRRARSRSTRAACRCPTCAGTVPRYEAVRVRYLDRDGERARRGAARADRGHVPARGRPPRRRAVPRPRARPDDVLDVGAVRRTAAAFDARAREIVERLGS